MSWRGFAVGLAVWGLGCAADHERGRDAETPDGGYCEPGDAGWLELGYRDPIDCPVQGADYGDCDEPMGWVYDGNNCVEARGCGCTDECPAFSDLYDCIIECGRAGECNPEKLATDRGEAPVCTGTVCDTASLTLREGAAEELEPWLSEGAGRLGTCDPDVVPSYVDDCIAPIRASAGLGGLSAASYGYLCAYTLIDVVTEVRCLDDRCLLGLPGCPDP